MFRGTRVPSRSPTRFGYGALTLSGCTFQYTRLRVRFLTPPHICNCAKTVPQPPRCNGGSLTQRGFGLFPFRSPLLGESRLISFPPGTEMFQFPGFAPSRLWIQRAVAGFSGSGFPIRISVGQCLCSGSPQLFAATYVLHRLLVPRHPPCALSSLASSSQRRLLHPPAAGSPPPRGRCMLRTPDRSLENIGLTFLRTRGQRARSHSHSTVKERGCRTPPAKSGG